jgi:uncharacterized protein
MPTNRFGGAAIPLWFMAAFVPLLASQIARLGQTEPLAWLACDWAGRLGALAVLWAVPTARAIAFTPQPRKIGRAEAILWVIGLAGLYLIVERPLQALIDSALPGTRLGHYPPSQGWLHVLDMSLGLALVAYQEELIFRRCSRAVVRDWLGDGWSMIAATSILFAGYHWWTGVGNMITALLFGIGAMWLYRRAGVLWPVVLSHYLADLAGFA